MADVELNDILRLGAIMELEGTHEVANVYHVRVAGGAPLGFAAVSEDVQEYMDEIYDNIAARLHTTMVADNLTMQNVTQDTTFGAFAWGAFANGLNTGEKLAPGLCCFTWARTLKPRVQIRKYYGVFTDDGILDGVWTSALQLSCRDALVDHINPFTGTNGLQMVGVAYNRTLETSTDALSVATSAEPAYQRRRKRGRGS